MKIALLGWGSLTWKDKEYPFIPLESWNTDGPLLPIEFSRISQKSEIVTLVINQNAKPVNVLWCIVGSDLDVEILKLIEREGVSSSKSISHVTANDCTDNSIKRIVQDWIKLKELDAAIWTGLGSRNSAGDYIIPGAEEIIEYLSTLSCDKVDEAKVYILKAPTQIDTEYRKAIVEHFGWRF